MFNLNELRMIQSLTDAQGVGVPFALAHVAASIREKLLANIAELEARENRQKAAQQLRVVAEPANASEESAA